jgi:septum formation protein
MARTKALAVVRQMGQLPVLAADTIVVLDGRICGKPVSAEEGVALLLELSGRSHAVLTAVALAAAGEIAHRVSVSEVRLRRLTRAECIAYWSTGEPRDKAGGYAVQGRAAVFIEHLSGSFSGVMGLPLYETAQLLAAAGVPYWQDGGA